jgi:hypothetical protein
MTTPTNWRALCAELNRWVIELAASHPNLSDSGIIRLNELTDRAIAALYPAEPESAFTDLATRPLLEKVARMGDCIGQQTVGEIAAVSSQAAAWLDANPPGQPVAIEPRGCPTPGACSCVEPVALSPKEVEAQEAFTQLRDEILNLSDGLEVNEVLGIIDNHTPEWV